MPSPHGGQSCDLSSGLGKGLDCEFLACGRGPSLWSSCVWSGFSASVVACPIGLASAWHQSCLHTVQHVQAGGYPDEGKGVLATPVLTVLPKPHLVEGPFSLTFPRLERSGQRWVFESEDLLEVFLQSHPHSPWTVILWGVSNSWVKKRCFLDPSHEGLEAAGRVKRGPSVSGLGTFPGGSTAKRDGVGLRETGWESAPTSWAL